MNPYQKESWDSSLISEDVEASSRPTRCPVCGDYSNHYHPLCPQCYGCGYNITPEQKAVISRIPNIDKMVLNRRNATVNDLLEESGIDLTPRNETVGDMLKRNGIDIYSK